MAMEDTSANKAHAKIRSVFDVSSDYFCGADIVGFDQTSSTTECEEPCVGSRHDVETEHSNELTRWSCNTCAIPLFSSLLEQRSHFKSDFHRLNVKRRLVGKHSISEEEFEKATEKTFSKADDISSISGSDEESDDADGSRKLPESKLSNQPAAIRNKLLIKLASGEHVSVWTSLILDDNEELLVKKDGSAAIENDCKDSTVENKTIIQRLKHLVREPQYEKSFRVVLLASGGHFAGCVFNGNRIIAHKTYHRYVTRAKAGGRQSTKDSTGKAPKSAGASLRRYNEMALKKEILELLAAWKDYLDCALCIYIFAPSVNGQIFFGGENAPLCHGCRVRHIPFVVRRPTLKEAKRVYDKLTSVYAADMMDAQISVQLEEMDLNSKKNIGKAKKGRIKTQQNMDAKILPLSRSASEVDSDVNSGNPEVLNQTSPLHEAAKSGNSFRVLELLEQEYNPCIKDERGRTAYSLAADKEVRNVFRRFMAANLDKWDWHAANVPSPLTQEMEEAQAAKQAEKHAKRKARAKEMKKQQKEKQKAKAQSVSLEAASLTVCHGQEAVSKLRDKGKLLPNMEAQTFQAVC
eukprot:TRINITY_DN2701_c0_g1_i3.p1 TRINITY_DN2701_c0_g1~~TRINITY_DN2701_c0_g1_i3.p1  ORF type:complete len:596 (+),score=123.56 TRINITY_DN2701_c0_g1_i3:55-1788(+)